MQGRLFIDLERELRSIPGEAATRTRIGRLYYGVYLEYRQFCEEHLGFNRHRLAREHQAVKNLIAAIDPGAAAILQGLRMARNQADYDLDLDARAIDEILEASLVSAMTLMSSLNDLRDRFTPA